MLQRRILAQISFRRVLVTFNVCVMMFVCWLVNFFFFIRWLRGLVLCCALVLTFYSSIVYVVSQFVCVYLCIQCTELKMRHTYFIHITPCNFVLFCLHFSITFICIHIFICLFVHFLIFIHSFSVFSIATAIAADVLSLLSLLLLQMKLLCSF